MASKTVISKENESNDNKNNIDQNKASTKINQNIYYLTERMIEKLDEFNIQINSNNSIKCDQKRKLISDNHQLVVSLINLPAIYDQKSGRRNKLAKSHLETFLIKRLEMLQIDTNLNEATNLESKGSYFLIFIIPF